MDQLTIQKTTSLKKIAEALSGIGTEYRKSTGKIPKPMSYPEFFGHTGTFIYCALEWN